MKISRITLNKILKYTPFKPLKLGFHDQQDLARHIYLYYLNNDRNGNAANYYKVRFPVCNEDKNSIVKIVQGRLRFGAKIHTDLLGEYLITMGDDDFDFRVVPYHDRIIVLDPGEGRVRDLVHFNDFQDYQNDQWDDVVLKAEKIIYENVNTAYHYKVRFPGEITSCKCEFDDRLYSREVVEEAAQELSKVGYPYKIQREVDDMGRSLLVVKVTLPCLQKEVRHNQQA